MANLLLVLLLAILSRALAVPAATASPAPSEPLAEHEIFIQPGPGLPSQESLGLSPATLYNLTIAYDAEVARRGVLLEKRDPMCHYNMYMNVAGRNHANACAIYLHNLGTTPCSAHSWVGGDMLMCQATGLPEPIAKVWGYMVPMSPPQTVTSWCQHVAHAVWWGVTQCPDRVTSIGRGFISDCVAGSSPIKAITTARSQDLTSLVCDVCCFNVRAFREKNHHRVVAAAATRRKPPLIMMQFLRPSASRRPSHTSVATADDSQTQRWSAEYQREAEDEQTRRRHAATVMQRSMRNSDPAALQTILKDNPDAVNVRDSEGRTPLHAAAALGRIAQLDILLARKDVDIDAVDSKKNTPLHLATKRDNEACVERLLKAGAKTEIADAKGHLPRYYAKSEGVQDLFDNPPKVEGRGGLRKRKATVPEYSEGPSEVVKDGKKGMARIASCVAAVSSGATASSGTTVSSGAESRRYSATETYEATEVDMAAPAVPPKGLQKDLCETFRGSFWESEGERQWSLGSVFDLVYGFGEKAAERRAAGRWRRAAGTRWFHLSAISKAWAKDLARNICAGKGYTDERSREMCDFIERVFESVDHEGPVRRHHFVRGRASKRRLDDDEMYAVVLPIIDVDKRDYFQLARAHRSEVLTLAHKENLLALNTADKYPADPVLGTHLKRMMQLSSFLDQPLPRSLDQSYHEYLDEKKMTMLDSDQALTRYISRLKAKSVDLVRKPTVKQASIFGRTSSDSVALPFIPSESSIQGHVDDRKIHIAGILSRNSDSPASGVDHEESQDPEPNDLITVPHFWLFKLDADTIITLYPERWDKTNEARLHDHVLKSVSNNCDIQDDPEAHEVAKTILKSCLSFEAKAFAKCITVNPNPDEPNDFEDVGVTFSQAYANSIAEMYTELTKRFEDLKEDMGSLSKDPNKFYRDAKEETKILIRSDDNIGEIRMIKRILQNQATTFDIFCEAVYGKKHRYRSATLETFEQLETDAERVRAMAVTLLDLRQREAAIEDALSQGEQSTMLFIFTTVTVLFSPLSLVCGILAMPIVGFPEIWDASPLAEVFGFATLGTAGLCILMWAIFKSYQAFEVWQRNKERQPRDPPPTGIPLATAGAKTEATAWTFPELRPRGGLRFRRSKVSELEKAVGNGKTASSGVGNGSDLGHRRSDIEKGM
ncbi:hypothetical protein DL765_010396 [Monosporascus sp. GIB2]|nr:hypothetical protein DL765_010396 [Monosporascus sp. GIB2]